VPAWAGSTRGLSGAFCSVFGPRAAARWSHDEGSFTGAVLGAFEVVGVVGVLPGVDSAPLLISGVTQLPNEPGEVGPPLWHSKRVAPSSPLLNQMPTDNGETEVAAGPPLIDTRVRRKSGTRPLTIREHVPMDVSPRLTNWINRVFPEGSADEVLWNLRDLEEWVYGGQDSERVQAALVIRTGGDWQRFQGMLRLAHEDVRDALVAGDLAHDDWRSLLDDTLGVADTSS
jgi:hypothetical protein